MLIRVVSIALLCAYSLALEAAVSAVELKRLKEVEQHLALKQRDVARQKLSLFKRAELSNEAFAISRQMLAGVYAGQQEYILAQQTLEEAAKLTGLDRQRRRSIAVERAKIYHFQQHWPEVVTQLARAGELDSAQRLMLASALFKLKRFEEVIRTLQRKEGDQGIQHWQLLSAALLKLQRYEQAVVLLQQQLSVEPNREQTWLQLAKSYLHIKKPQAAAAALHSAFMRDVLRSEQGIEHLVALMLQQGLPQQASAVQRASIEAGKLKDSARNWLALSAMQHRAKDLVGAQRSARKALEREPTLKSYRQLSRLLLQQQKWREAYQVLAQMIAWNTDAAAELEVQLQMLRASYHLDDVATAKRHLLSAVGIAPDSPKLKPWQALLATSAERVIEAG